MRISGGGAVVEVKRGVSLIKPEENGAGTRQFGHLNVRERVIDAGDRAISIDNISTISIYTETTKGPRALFFLFAAIVGLAGLAALIQSTSYAGPPPALGVVLLCLSGILIFAGVRSKDHVMSFLTIATNDGSRTVFPSRDRKYLRTVKDFIAEKINRNDLTAVQYFDNRSTSVQAETANIGTDQSIRADAIVMGDNNLVASRSAGAHVGTTSHSYSAVNSPGAQVGAGNTATGNVIHMRVTDFSSVLPQITELREFYGRTAGASHVEERLAELERLMKAGAPAPSEKSRVRSLASDLGTILQAYPPMVQLFQHIVRMVGG